MRLLVVSCAPVVSSFTLSLACLLLTAITVHDTCSYDGSFPLHPLVVLQSAPFSLLCLRPSLSFFCLPHTVAHGDTSSLIMSLFVSLPSPPASTVLMCLCAGTPTPPCVCLSTSVMSEFWWNLTSRSSGDDMPDESLNQYLLVFFSFFFSLSFFLLSLIVFPPSPRCEHSTSAPPPAALVHPCAGGTWGPSGSQGLWDGSLRPPTSHVQPLRAISREQINKPTGARRRPGDDHTASLCRWPKAHND